MIRLIEEFRFGVVTRVYLRDSLLIDMTAEKTTRRGADSTRTDQIGKVFLVVGQDVRKCLVCERLVTRRSASEHSAFVACRKSA
jgi:hypothetical protein